MEMQRPQQQYHQSSPPPQQQAQSLQQQQQQPPSGTSGRRSSRSGGGSGLPPSALTAISEGDEHATLMDVLAMRDGPLVEEELWAVCRECCLAVRALGDASEAFQTLCLSPDTVAFDGHGNVRLLNADASDNPADLTCQPPEFYQFGNSYKGHVYSLGSAMLMAAHYAVPDGGKTRHSRRLSDLLADMTEEDYDARTDIDRVITECDAHLRGRSSKDICRAVVAKARGDDTALSYEAAQATASSGSTLSCRPATGKPLARCHFTENLAGGSCAENATASASVSSNLSTAALTGVKRELSFSSSKGTPKHQPPLTTLLSTDDCPPSSKAKRLGPDRYLFATADTGAAASAFSTPPAAGELPPDKRTLDGCGGSKNREQQEQERKMLLPSATAAASVKAVLALAGEDQVHIASVLPTHRKPLPDEYSSSATHFTPIILARDESKGNDDGAAATAAEVGDANNQQQRQPPSVGSSTDPNRLTAKKIKELKKKLLRSRQLVETAATASGGGSDLISAKDGPSAAASGSPSPSASRSPAVAFSPQGASSPVIALSLNSALPEHSSGPGCNKPLGAVASCQWAGSTSSTESLLSQPLSGAQAVGGSDVESHHSTGDDVIRVLSTTAPLATAVSTYSLQPAGASCTAQTAVATYSDEYAALQLPRAAGSSTSTAAAPLATAAAPQSSIPLSNSTLATPPFATTVPVPFVVQRDPSSGALHLVPLYPSLGSTVFLPHPTLAAVQSRAGGSVPDPSASTAADVSSTATPVVALSQHVRAPYRSDGSAPIAYATLLSSDDNGVSSSLCDSATLHCSTSGLRESSPPHPSLPVPPSPSFSKDSGVGSVGSRYVGGDPQLIERLLASGSVRHNKLLGQLIKLIRDEFAFDGYLDNGVEDLAMAEYTASLAGLKWDTFSSAITEKYCDLYWEEDLLSHLFEVINGKQPPTSVLSAGAHGKRSKAGVAAGVGLPKAAAVAVAFCGHSPFRPISAGAEIDAAAAGDRLAAPAATASKDSLAGTTMAKPAAAARRSPKHRRSSSLTRESAGATGFDPLRDSAAPVAGTTRQGQAAQSITLVRGRSTSVQDLFSSPHEQRLMSRSFSQSALDRPIVNLRKSDSRVSLTLLGAGLMVSGLSGSMPVIRIHGSCAPDDLPSTQARRSTTVDRSLRCTPRSSQRSDSPPREPRSATSRCSEGSGSASTRLSLRPGSDMSGQVQDVKVGVSETSSGSELEKTRAIDTIYYTSTLARRLDERFRQAIDKADSATRNELVRRLQDTDQQLTVHMKHRAKTLKYCRRLPDTVQQGKVAYDQKAVLDKALADLNEANDQLEFLMNVKRHLEMLLAESNSLADTHVYSLAKCGQSERLVLSAAPENPLLLFKSRVDGLSRRGGRVLHAGTALGLMANLFSRGCFTQQYAHNFFYCFRYFTTPSHLLNFITSKFESAALQQEQREEKAKVEARSLDLLQAWLEGYYSVDFKHDSDLQDSFTAFLQESVAQNNPRRAEALFLILEDLASGRKNDLTHVSSSLRDDIDVTLKVGNREWQQTAKKLSFKLNSSSGKPPSVMYKRSRSGIISCIRNADDPHRDRESYHLTCPRKTEAFSLADYSSQTIAEQLTLMEQALFERCHPVHFMNSRAQGIAASLASLGHSAASRALWDDSAVSASGGSLFVGSYAHDAAIQCMIEHSQSLSYWVAAELVSCNSVKSQLALLTKFIYIAKICKEIRNYATCVAVIDGLENLVVRQLPAWKDIPAKSIEELKNVKVFLSSDAMCLTNDEATSAPTLPSVLLFVLHMQQLERGAFTLANGMYKWSKMKNIAKAADQIRLFKQRCYEFQPRPELCDDLVSRMKDLCHYDLQTLAASRDVNFQRTSTGKWANAFRKLRGAFAS